MSKSKVKMPFVGDIKDMGLAQKQHHVNFARGRHLFMPFTERIQILNLNGVSDTAWTDKDVSANVSDAAFAALLAVFFKDSASATVEVSAKFRENGASSDGTGFVFGRHLNNQWQSNQLIIPLDADKIFEYSIEASGANTATLHVYLIGYFSKIT